MIAGDGRRSGEPGGEVEDVADEHRRSPKDEAAGRDAPRGSGKQFAPSDDPAERDAREGSGDQFADAQRTEGEERDEAPEGTGKQFPTDDLTDKPAAARDRAKGSGKQFAPDDGPERDR
jgi:hypothetical protein